MCWTNRDPSFGIKLMTPFSPSKRPLRFSLPDLTNLFRHQNIFLSVCICETSFGNTKQFPLLGRLNDFFVTIWRFRRLFCEFYGF